jgi:hypothetical protein
VLAHVTIAETPLIVAVAIVGVAVGLGLATRLADRIRR